MVDGLLDLGPVIDAISGIVGSFGGYLAIPLGVYLGLFVLGLIIESVQAKKGGD